MPRAYNPLEPEVPKEPEYLDIDYERPIKVTRKVLIPSFRNPNINYVGRIIGPKGICVKKLVEEFNCKIQVLGRGSMNDKVLEEALRKSTDPKHAHLTEQLHVKIEVIATPSLAFRRISDLMDRLSIVFKSATPYKQTSEVQTTRNSYRGYKPAKEGYTEKPACNILNGWSDVEENVEKTKKKEIVLPPGIAIHTASFSQPPPKIIPRSTVPPAEPPLVDYSTFHTPVKTGRLKFVFNRSSISDKPALKKSSGSIELRKTVLDEMSFHTINSKPLAAIQEEIKLPSTFGRSKSQAQSDPNGNFDGSMTTPVRSNSDIQKRKRALEFDAEELSPTKKLASVISCHSPIGPKSMVQGSEFPKILHSTFVKKENI